mmetsp:Transcript_39910/g.40545  ORF Transcript_39910/g.40545 Transcript_39910/m.40545 type:complete len:130 (-) Transcript_39910:84-473(-)
MVLSSTNQGQTHFKMNGECMENGMELLPKFVLQFKDNTFSIESRKEKYLISFFCTIYRDLHRYFKRPNRVYVQRLSIKALFFMLIDWLVPYKVANCLVCKSVLTFSLQIYHTSIQLHQNSTNIHYIQFT